MKPRFRIVLAAGVLAATAGIVLAQAQANTAAHSIVDAESGFLLGGSAGGKWLKAPAIAKSMRGGESYRVYSARGVALGARGSKPKSQGAPCEDTLFVDLQPKRGTVAVAGSWKAVPRAPRVESTTQPAYRAAVAAILKQRGIARPIVQIRQVWRVDLEGDGTDEVLVNAARYASYAGSPGSISAASRAGDYALVMLRKIVGGKVKTIMLAQEYYPKAKTFNAPGFYKLGAVVDANGDGTMEILTRGTYYEGQWTDLHEVKNGAAREVLTAGCGA